MIGRVTGIIAAWSVTLVGATAYIQAVDPQSSATPAAAPAPQTAAAGSALVSRYCAGCHNDKLKTAGLSLSARDFANVGADAAVWEAVVKKLDAGVMPPLMSRQPEKASADAFRVWLQNELDKAATAHPDPGRTETFHRLNRAEYQNAVRDLLGIEIDVTGMLPGDDASYGFDNIAGVLKFSPTLMERYLGAARKIGRAAVGLPVLAPNYEVFHVADDLEQDDRLDDLPFGTRGGTLIRYLAPVDGEYLIKPRLARQLNSQDLDVPRFVDPQDLEISVDGQRIQVFTLEGLKPTSQDPEPGLANAGSAAVPRQARPKPSEDGAAAPPRPRQTGAGRVRGTLDSEWEVRVPLKAGTREIAITFLNDTNALRATLLKPYLRPFAPGTNQWSSRKGAYLNKVEITGPFNAGPPSDTPGRKRIFTCKPSKSTEDAACAKTILTTLARRAYRRPVDGADVDRLLAFYQQGRGEGDFEAGIELAIERLLMSPEFLFRTEADPAGIAPATNYRVSDLEMASRLSFFLWSSIPDDELLDLAVQKKLSNPDVLRRQVTRMLADKRSRAIVDNFVGQWLYLRNVPSLGSEPYKDPDFDESLRDAMRRETELFFESVVKEDRSLIDLLQPNYTFLNERLAKHYGIPDVYGTHFRRVSLPAGSVRGGLLGQASILAVTSYANRTSPVKRGKWILENIMGTPPPSPPAVVPSLDEKQKGTKALTMRERMTEHRENPVCASCHAMMDPLGFALENFDQAGRWRAIDEGVDSRRSTFAAIDPTGMLPDGTKFSGPKGLRDSLLSRPDRFAATFTEKLLTYALGRGLEYYDVPAVRQVVRAAGANDYRFSSIVMGVVTSLPFQMRRSQS